MLIIILILFILYFAVQNPHRPRYEGMMSTFRGGYKGRHMCPLVSSSSCFMNVKYAVQMCHWSRNRNLRMEDVKCRRKELGVGLSYRFNDFRYTSRPETF